LIVPPAEFAARFAPEVREIVIVSDQHAEAFGRLPGKARVATIVVAEREETYRYRQIYRSRLIKLQAPLQARTDGILMIDSDLNLLKSPGFHIEPRTLYGTFRQSRLIDKLADAPGDTAPAYYRDTVRPFLVDHVNGSFLAATRQTWRRICWLWLALYQDTWGSLVDTQPPTDQLPLAAVLDLLDLRTVDLGAWFSWPVSIRIGGTSSTIPKEVVGAHGGFPLSEWQKYLSSPDTLLRFEGQQYTRMVRYMTDAEKAAMHGPDGSGLDH
jgi:hypothetical protein